MKRCLNCCALIQEECEECPYCGEKPWMVVDEFISLSENFEKVGEAFRQLGITAKEFERRAEEVMRDTVPPNEMRRMIGLKEINNEEDK